MIRMWPSASVRSGLACALLVAGLSGPAGAQDSIDNLSKRLIELRGEVEELNDELDSAKEQHRSRMQSLARQRGDVEASLEQARMQLEEVESRVAEAREDAEEAGSEADELEPVVLGVLDRTERLVEDRLPFKREERLAELENIRTRLNQGVITPHQAVNTLWAYYEDEIRLTGDNGLYQQTVRHDGDEQLADVVRLGMVMMFYKTSDGRFGSVVREDDDWQYRGLESGDSARVADLFETFQRQVRTGYFELPNAIVSDRVQPAAADDGGEAEVARNDIRENQ